MGKAKLGKLGRYRVIGPPKKGSNLAGRLTFTTKGLEDASFSVGPFHGGTDGGVKAEALSFAKPGLARHVRTPFRGSLVSIISALESTSDIFLQLFWAIFIPLPDIIDTTGSQPATETT